MTRALAALALALSATVAIAQTPEQLTPEQQRLRDYFKPGGQVEKDNPGFRQRVRDGEINRRALNELRSGRGGMLEVTDPHTDCRTNDPETLKRCE
jgi:hypothetical protein